MIKIIVNTMSTKWRQYCFDKYDFINDYLKKILFTLIFPCMSIFTGAKAVEPRMSAKWQITT